MQRRKRNRKRELIEAIDFVNASVEANVGAFLLGFGAPLWYTNNQETKGII